ncbi:hypothetical protein ACFLQR_04445 [Verrucomicrobiota bacterium]
MDLTNRDKRIWVKGILVDCPVGKPLESCPASKIRGLPLPNLIATVNSMSDRQIDAIIKYHENCAKERDKKNKSRKG